MNRSPFDPVAYLKERIKLFENQIAQIDEEIANRRNDHERILAALNNAKAKYKAALTNGESLREFSMGKDFDERRQRMHQTIRGVNTGIFDEVRVYKSFLKSLNAERRRIERELQELKLKLRTLGELSSDH